jgi:ACS family D-galactonate transporter-like MFS transporter
MFPMETPSLPASPARSAPLATRRRWVIVASLFLFMVINFADKAVLGLVALPLMRDMSLTHAQFGVVGSAFFLLFALSGIGFGVFADRMNAKWLLAGLAMTWTVAQLPLAWPTSFAVLVACRILLGFGEGPASPLALHVVYSWFDDHERGLPTTIVQQGATTGIILAGPLLTFIAQRWYWHAAFLSMAVVGILWTVLWLCVGKTGTASATVSPERAVLQRRIPFSTLLTDRTIVGVMLQGLVGYSVIAIGVTWVPAYFRVALGYSATEAGWLFALQVAAQIPVGIALAMLSHRLLARGVSSKIARGALISAACMTAGVAYCLIYIDTPPAVKIALMAIACALSLQAFTFGPLLVAEVTPASRRGAMLAITNSIATLAGLVAPAAMGKLIGVVANNGGYEIGLAVTGILLLIVGAAGFVLIDPDRSRTRLERAARF